MISASVIRQVISIGRQPSMTNSVLPPSIAIEI